MNNLAEVKKAEMVTLDDVLSALRIVAVEQKNLRIEQDSLKREVRAEVAKIETRLENHVRLAPSQARELQRAVASRVHFHLPTQEHYDRLKNKLFSAIYRDIKNAFHVPEYREIPMIRYEAAMEFVRTWYPQVELDKTA